MQHTASGSSEPVFVALGRSGTEWITTHYDHDGLAEKAGIDTRGGLPEQSEWALELEGDESVLSKKAEATKQQARCQHCDDC
ncbi:hypothetical protein ACJ73_02540 [Blastomyces percursus]|uniref:Uncharacterized protein n=1 Tax=Blastomyces percursus TaxID=1658174 RepID=A0A1J9RC57_9EURO|nr:hypothetical protein ACJ73_02540 [Blastomyces percursus]